MATTIGGYSVSLGLNASGLIDGSKLARGEMAALNRTLQSVVSPGERLAKQLNTLDKALADGAISVETHGEAVKRLEAKYKALDKVVDSSAKKTVSHTESLIKAAKAFAAVYIAGKGLDSLKDAAERIDVLANESQKLGESVPNLQRFQYGMAQLGNLSADQASNSLAKLTKSIGEASLGSEPMQANFARLGLNFQELAKLAPVDRFIKVADAIAKVEDPTKRMATATSVFGKSASDLLPIINSSSGSLQAMADEADRLGITMTQQTADGIATANDAMDRMSASIDAISEKIVGTMAPAIESMSSGVDGFAKKVDPLLPWLERAFSLAAKEVNLFLGAVEHVNYQLSAMKQLLTGGGMGGFSESYEQMIGVRDFEKNPLAKPALPTPKPIVIRDQTDEMAKQANIAAKTAQNVTKQTQQIEKQATIQKNLQRPAVLGQVAPKPMQQAVSVAVQSLKIDSPKSLDLGGQGASDFLSELRNKQIEEKANSNSVAIKKADEQLKVQREQLAELRKMRETQPRNKR